MSRILEALKKAVPRSRNLPEDLPLKPLIFEKVSLKTPDVESVRSEVVAKKDLARLRYLLNERAKTFVSEETRRLLVVLGVLLIVCGSAAFALWPKGGVSPKKQSEQTVLLNRRMAELEVRLADAQTEVARLQQELALAQAAAGDEEIESLRADVRRLNRRLAVMLQDNLEKDEQITRLSGR